MAISQPTDSEQVRRAKSAKATCENEFQALPNVTGVGVGYKIVNGRRTDQVCVRVYVAKKLPLSQLDATHVIPASINGVPTDVIEAEFKMESNGEDNLASRRERRDPMVAGISIGRSVENSAGTLGSWAFDNVTSDAYLLSNWHVLDGNKVFVSGTPIVQPGRRDGGDVDDDAVAVLHRIGLTRRTDAAVARLTGQRALRREALGLGPIADIGDPALGLAVRKSGKTTGVTRGIVTDIGATVKILGEFPDHVLDPEFPELGARFVDQIVIEGPAPLSDFGDSGSVWIDDSNWLIGLHFAGSPGLAAANRMQAVVDTLGISIGLSAFDLLTIGAADL